MTTQSQIKANKFQEKEYRPVQGKGENNLLEPRPCLKIYRKVLPSNLKINKRYF